MITASPNLVVEQPMLSSIDMMYCYCVPAFHLWSDITLKFWRVVARSCKDPNQSTKVDGTYCCYDLVIHWNFLMLTFWINSCLDLQFS